MAATTAYDGSALLIIVHFTKGLDNMLCIFTICAFLLRAPGKALRSAFPGLGFDLSSLRV